MKKKLKAIIGSIIAILILALLIVFSILQKRVTPIPDGTVGNTAGNANNGGYFCEYDGVVYFSNPYDNGSLYSMSPDESNMKKLISANVSHINAGGSYLFYYQEEASGSSGLGYIRSSHGIYRSLLNGKNITCLSKDLLFNIQLVDNYLYYLSSADKGAEFYQLKIDSSEKELLANTGWNFACAMPDGTVYYNGTESNHYLYRYDTKSGTSNTVWKGNLWYPVYDNGYIYYLDVASDYRLCRYSLSGDVVEILTHDRVDCFNLAGGYIYYQKNSASEPALMRMTLDGQNVETIMEGNYTHLSATSRYVYFSAFGSDVPVYRTPVSGAIQVSTFNAALEAATANMKK
ncbi:MAG: DUF5050 domain-containing protein [Lachnospiraceae bacterium]